ncbi:hypothetical protein TRFO_35332 [Tritrichomonas foetus]|uniref:Serine/threonine-protein phosphatase n=1 Tax=Tritrichomonas foetus TaxID=1144522 RepID=A0A1J4JIU1_9EUKA|nr:hypothetical protein TRFO_35332 [Tritrichomonas foetus]|eukprot:OHS98271.1 hypothetical protein TRFO_35332 [Tritrichomonas foetus]
MNRTAASDVILKAFNTFIGATEKEICLLGTSQLPLPMFDNQVILDLCYETLEVLRPIGGVVDIMTTKNGSPQYTARITSRSWELPKTHQHTDSPKHGEIISNSENIGASGEIISNNGENIKSDIHSETIDSPNNNNPNLITPEANQKTLYADGPVYIVGDLHGNLHDLLRIYNRIYELGDWNIIFLGDYIDRGNYSLEVILFLFALLCKYPKNIVLIRGNHEFPCVGQKEFLLDELKQAYTNAQEIYDMFHSVFSWMPLACVIDKSILCLHGGLSPLLEDVDQIRRINYPIVDYEDPLIADILWSDPCTTVNSFVSSTRGVGSLFGIGAASAFLKKNNLKYLIRAHQCASEGYEQVIENVFTIFSTSFYTDLENRGGFVLIDNNHCFHNKNEQNTSRGNDSGRVRRNSHNVGLLSAMGINLDLLSTNLIPNYGNNYKNGTVINNELVFFSISPFKAIKREKATFYEHVATQKLRTKMLSLGKYATASYGPHGGVFMPQPRKTKSNKVVSNSIIPKTSPMQLKRKRPSSISCATFAGQSSVF